MTSNGLKTCDRPVSSGIQLSRVRAPLGGHILPPPCVTPELIGAARRAEAAIESPERDAVRIKNFL